jgi:hypothetical protein
MWYKFTAVLEKLTASIFLFLNPSTASRISDRPALSWEDLQAPQLYSLLRVTLKMKMSMEH